MPLSDKNIVITPNVGQSADPTIVFTGANTANAYMINVKVYPTSSGTLSFEGGVGQLFSISNTLTGTIFSVNDISGIPSIEVIDSGVIKLTQYNGNVTIGASNTVNASSNLIGALMVNGGIAATGNIYSGALYITGPTSNGITFSDYSTLVTSNNITAGFNQANSAASFANAAFTLANNTTGVDTTQNTNISSAQSYANGSFVTANSAASFANGAFTLANNTTGVDNTQNTNISSAQSYANGSFVTANSAASFANGAFTLANNTTGVDNTQNTNISSAQSYANGAFTAANVAYGRIQITANTGDLLANGVNTSVTGNILLGLATTAVSAASYANANTISVYTVDTKGRLTYAANVPVSITTAQVTGLPINTFIQANTNGGIFANGTQGATQTGNVLMSISNTHITNAVTSNTTMGLQVASLGVGTAASGTSGEIRATNSVTAFYSDKRLKDNIKRIENALEKLCKISGVTYNSNILAESFGYTDKSEQVGVIAQELEQVLPHVVKLAPFDTKYENGKEISISGENYKTVQYERIIPLLIEAIKEQQIQIDELKEIINGYRK